MYIDFLFRSEELSAGLVAVTATLMFRNMWDDLSWFVEGGTGEIGVVSALRVGDVSWEGSKDELREVVGAVREGSVFEADREEGGGMDAIVMASDLESSIIEVVVEGVLGEEKVRSSSNFSSGSGIKSW